MRGYPRLVAHCAVPVDSGYGGVPELLARRELRREPYVAHVSKTFEVRIPENAVPASAPRCLATVTPE